MVAQSSIPENVMILSVAVGLSRHEAETVWDQLQTFPDPQHGGDLIRDFQIVCASMRYAITLPFGWRPEEIA